MTGIRPLERSDLPQVVGLHARVAATRSAALPPGLERHLERIFFDYPWADEELPPLAYEDDGTIVGLLGSSVRRLLWRGEPARMRITSHFLVEQRARGAVGLLLLREALKGPQDLSVTDTANPDSQRVWERLGGHTVYLNSVAWLRLFRPGRFARAVLSWRGRRVLRTAVAGVAPPVDYLTVRAAGSKLRPSPSGAEAEELSGSGLAEAAADYSLRLAYEDDEFVEWLFPSIGAMWIGGRLVGRLVRMSRGMGSYVYVLTSDGVAEVLHIAASEDLIGDVLDHLFEDAWRRGASAALGRVEPRLLEPLARRGCLLRRSSSSTLVHSADPEVADAIQAGRGLLTRIDADWWIYGAWWDATVGMNGVGRT